MTLEGQRRGREPGISQQPEIRDAESEKISELKSWTESFSDKLLTFNGYVGVANELMLGTIDDPENITKLYEVGTYFRELASKAEVLSVNLEAYMSFFTSMNTSEKRKVKEQLRSMKRAIDAVDLDELERVVYAGGDIGESAAQATGMLGNLAKQIQVDYARLNPEEAV